MASETREGGEKGTRARMRGDFEDACSSAVRLENARARETAREVVEVVVDGVGDARGG